MIVFWGDDFGLECLAHENSNVSVYHEVRHCPLDHHELQDLDIKLLSIF